MAESFVEFAVASVHAEYVSQLALYLRTIEVETGLGVGDLPDPIEILKARAPHDNRSPLLQIYDEDVITENQRHGMYLVQITAELSWTGDTRLAANELFIRRYLDAIKRVIVLNPTLTAKVVSAVIEDGVAEAFGSGDVSRIRHVRNFRITVRIHNPPTQLPSFPDIESLYSLQLDGTNEFAANADSLIGAFSELTFVLWYKLLTYAHLDRFSIWQYPTETFDWQLYTPGMRFELASSHWRDFNSPPTGIWVCDAVVIDTSLVDGEQLRVFRMLAGETSFTKLVPTLVGTRMPDFLPAAGNFAIGGFPTGVRGLNVRICDHSLWTVALTLAQVEELQDVTHKPANLSGHSQSDYLLQWCRYGDDPLDSAVGTIYDQSGLDNNMTPGNCEIEDIVLDAP